MWFLHNGVILTTDNLASRRWQGCKKCCFCYQEETVQHLFQACPFETLVWRMVNKAFNLPPPTSMTNMFGNWLRGVPSALKAQIRVGVCDLLWALWNSRNDLVLNKYKFPKLLAGHLQSHQLLCVVYPTSRGGQWIHGLWVQPTRDGCTGFLQPGWMAIE